MHGWGENLQFQACFSFNVRTAVDSIDPGRPAQAHSPPLIMPEALPEGCWPTMITPFTSAGAIDYAVLEALIGELAST